MDEEFDELRREFLVEAEQKVRDIEQAWRNREPEERDAIEKMIYLAHQLKGAGGSYGFQSISTDAAELENSLEHGLSGTDTADPQIEKRIATLSSEVSARMRELAVSR